MGLKLDLSSYNVITFKEVPGPLKLEKSLPFRTRSQDEGSENNIAELVPQISSEAVDDESDL